MVFAPALVYGFRLPLPLLFSDLLRRWNLCPSQLTPNSWRFMAAYVAACRVGKIEMSGRHMSGVMPGRFTGSSYTLSLSGLKLLDKKDVKGWHSLWFLVRSLVSFEFGCHLAPMSPCLEDTLDTDERRKAKSALKLIDSSSFKSDRFPRRSFLEESGLSLRHPRARGRTPLFALFAL